MQYLSGRPFPLGSEIGEYHGKQGVNFALFSRHASGVDLCLFCNGQESRVPMVKNGEIWHVFVEGLAAGTQYGFRVSGEVNEAAGLLFNPQKLLLDPHTKQIIGAPDLSTQAACDRFLWNDPRDNAEFTPKSVVIDCKFDWENDRLLHTPWAETIIYEAHVKGFSRLHPEIPPELAGTFAGLAHPVSVNYLKKLGITAIELLPITHHLDEPHLQKIGLQNYWGYNVMGHFAVDPKLAADQQNPLTEFKQMVKTLHQAGIEVIMDVVFNHTAEAGKDGITLCQRGIDNRSYYWLTEQGDYHNWTGCGNALNLSDWATLRWVIDCLCYWVEDCHIDGFRFDLGTILGRTPTFSDKSAFFSAVYSNPILAKVKLIAEPWDIGEKGYQLGKFPPFFAEWNDRFRDKMRGFFLQQNILLGQFARRFAGSDDIFTQFQRPANSINFLTAHDGFTLHDLVSYNDKHNEANGEQNRDGHSHNHSNNHGIEGETDNIEVLMKRHHAKRALLAALLLSHGTPMLLAGDELGHSQQGNNNAYCQDNELTWLNWAQADCELQDYVATLIHIRKQIPLLRQNSWWQLEEVQWLNADGVPLTVQEWQRKRSTLQIFLQNRWLIVINARHRSQQFLLPDGEWQPLLGIEKHDLIIDTSAVTLNHLGVCVFQKHN